MRPASGASALPGGWLPCGSPSEGDNLARREAHPKARCAVAINVNVPGIRNSNDSTASSIPGLHPKDLASAYGFPSGATGMTVGIVDAYDDPRAQSDLNIYRSKFGLPPCTSRSGCFKKVNQGGRPGPYPRSSPAWSAEIALDIEMVSAVCPRCPILLVEANSASIADLGTSVDTAVALGARVVSNSYYAVEWPGESSEDAHYTHPGIAITASSGDQAAPYYPASSPFVTAVGGTSLTLGEGGDVTALGGESRARSARAWSETAWPYSGKGCSRFEARPAFQIPVCATRSAVDMAVVGDPQTGVSIFATQAGGWVVAGGTSVGAPVIAAAYALSGNPTGPAFSYGRPTDFHDIPPAGFDPRTGLGSPNGVGGF